MLNAREEHAIANNLRNAQDVSAWVAAELERYASEIERVHDKQQNSFENCVHKNIEEAKEKDCKLLKAHHAVIPDITTNTKEDG